MSNSSRVHGNITNTDHAAATKNTRPPRPKPRAARTKRWLAASDSPHNEQILEAACGGKARLARERRLSARTPVRVGLTSPLVGVGFGRTVAPVWKSQLPPAFGLGSRARLRLHHPSHETVALLLRGEGVVDAGDGQHPFRSAREPSCCAMAADDTGLGTAGWRCTGPGRCRRPSCRYCRTLGRHPVSPTTTTPWPDGSRRRVDGVRREGGRPRLLASNAGAHESLGRLPASGKVPSNFRLFGKGSRARLLMLSASDTS